MYRSLVRFMRRGPLSPAVDGTLDYLLAAALIAAPLGLHFHDETAKVFVLAVGGGQSTSSSSPIVPN